jgi:hypothetical protein
VVALAAVAAQHRFEVMGVAGGHAHEDVALDAEEVVLLAQPRQFGSLTVGQRRIGLSCCHGAVT